MFHAPAWASVPPVAVQVSGEYVGGHHVLRCTSPAIPNAIAALLLFSRDETGQIPHAYFGWTEGNPIVYLLKFLAFGEGDWRVFQPERYSRPLLRTWVVPLTDTLNTPVDAQLPLALDGDRPLPPGVYYLRIRTPEGPRADLLLLVSPVRLALQSSPEGFLLWATDIISATPVVSLSLAVYQDGALLDRGTTDSRGLWRIGRSPAGCPIARSPRR